VLVVIILDAAIYLQHVASHRLPILWRLHQMHHADPEFDVTTAIRFHPFEIALSMLYKVVLVVPLGPAPAAVIVFEIILNALAMFNHANIALPLWLDRALRMIVVTPDMHRVHHSIDVREHSTNFGFSLSVWDRLFGSYKPQPALGHDGMVIGLPQYQSDKPTELQWSLALPFAADPKTDTQNRR
jgi:sterol desaturase/sphingolipid hydroxylase (fatty acid hydroxylase superfamily)